MKKKNAFTAEQRRAFKIQGMQLIVLGSKLFKLGTCCVTLQKRIDQRILPIEQEIAAILKRRPILRQEKQKRTARGKTRNGKSIPDRQ